MATVVAAAAHRASVCGARRRGRDAPEGVEPVSSKHCRAERSEEEELDRESEAPDERDPMLERGINRCVSSQRATADEASRPESSGTVGARRGADERQAHDWQAHTRVKTDRVRC
jgi:hypothetical protein